MGPETFTERTTNLFLRVTRASEKTITVLCHGNNDVSHQAKIVGESGHRLIYVENKSFTDGENVEISLDENGEPKIKYVDTYRHAIIDLTKTPRLHNGEAGRKMQRLSLLHSFGIKVPQGFVITSEAVWAHLESIGISPFASDWENNWEKVRETIRHSPFAPDLESKIETALQNHAYESYVIRSSGNEDGKNDSRAGLYESHTDVAAGQITAKIKQTIASYFSPESIRASQNQDRRMADVAIGVGVQEYIYDPKDERQVGGVAFTYPKKIVMRVTNGTPEAIVSADERANQVRITVQRGENNPATCDLIGKKEKAEKIAEVAQQLLPQLLRTISEIEVIFGDYQDIEWVYNQKHGLVIVQARPL
jgi:phosphoenolpyruvate synthase/pyruvate phosphate dikinase